MEKTKSNFKTILLVEDEESLQLIVSKKCKLNNLNVLQAKSYDEAIEKLKNEIIDAVWVDHYLLGKENGLDLVKKMKEEDSPWKKIPIFVVSNTASDDKIKSYLHLGVNRYYTKADFKLGEIIKYINKCLKKGKDE